MIKDKRTYIGQEVDVREEVSVHGNVMIKETHLIRRKKEGREFKDEKSSWSSLRDRQRSE